MRTMMIVTLGMLLCCSVPLQAEEAPACDAAIADLQSREPMLQLALDCAGADRILCEELAKRPTGSLRKERERCAQKIDSFCVETEPFFSSLEVLAREERARRYKEARQGLCMECSDCTHAACCCAQPDGGCECLIYFYCGNIVTVYCSTGGWCPCGWHEQSLGGECRLRCVCC